MITIKRQYFPEYTAGVLTATGGGLNIALQLFTIELPWRDNLVRKSCIPEGRYSVVPHMSPRFGRTLFFPAVPGRSEILFHAGNTTADLLGCIAPGTSRGSTQQGPFSFVHRSRQAMDLLLSLYWDKPGTEVLIQS